jgi:hypothetical protein
VGEPTQSEQDEWMAHPSRGADVSQHAAARTGSEVGVKCAPQAQEKVR